MARQIACQVDARFVGQIGTLPQSGIRPIQLSDLRRCSPGQIFLPGMSKKFKAAVLQALRQGEAGGTLGDESPMPPALTARNFPACRVEGQRGRAEFPCAPSPLGLQYPQHVPEVFRCVSCPRGQPPDHLIQLRQQPGPLVSLSCSGVSWRAPGPAASGPTRSA